MKWVLTWRHDYDTVKLHKRDVTLSWIAFYLSKLGVYFVMNMFSLFYQWVGRSIGKIGKHIILKFIGCSYIQFSTNANQRSFCMSNVLTVNRTFLTWWVSCMINIIFLTPITFNCIIRISWYARVLNSDDLLPI